MDAVMHDLCNVCGASDANTVITTQFQDNFKVYGYSSLFMLTVQASTYNALRDLQNK